MIRKIFIMVLIAAFMLLSFNCASSRKSKGTAVGAGSGAVVGGLIGKAAGNTALGAILGAVIGGAAGAYIGNYMDKQAAEIESDIDGATVERVGEGIKITFDSGILFDVNKATLKAASKENLAKLAEILNKYPDTNILLEGHTDASGSEEYNQTLSEQRARSVANYLAGLNVSTTRLTEKGYGEAQPVATNDTPEGRQMNRRVEVAIWANEKLQKAAKNKTQG